MRRALSTGIFLAGLFLAHSVFAQQSSSSAPAAPAAAPMTDRQKEELHARILMSTKQYIDAAKAYIHLAQEDPHNPSYPNFVGLAMLQLNDVADAEKYFQKATKADKKFADAYNNLGAVEFALKHYGPAIRQYQKAVAIQPQTAGFYGNLAYAYFAEKQMPKAMDNFRKALALDPTAFESSDRTGSVMQYRAVTDHGLFDFMLAKSYAQKGDAMHCAFYLRKAVDEAYKNVASAKTDPAFAKVRSDPDVKLVLDPLPDPGKTAASKAPAGG